MIVGSDMSLNVWLVLNKQNQKIYTVCKGLANHFIPSEQWCWIHLIAAVRSWLLCIETDKWAIAIDIIETTISSTKGCVIVRQHHFRDSHQNLYSVLGPSLKLLPEKDSNQQRPAVGCPTLDGAIPFVFFCSFQHKTKEAGHQKQSWFTKTRHPIIIFCL